MDGHVVGCPAYAHVLGGSMLIHCSSTQGLVLLALTGATLSVA
jgi:hypothetical protein